MVVSPSILLLDEPFANLDRNLKSGTAEFIRDFQQEYGITTICVTHDLQEAFMMSDKIGIMLEGRLCQYDDAQVVYNKPVSGRVAAFLGHVNTIPVSLAGAVGLADTVPVGVESFSIRAEGLELAVDPDGYGLVEDVVFAGQYTIYHVRVDRVRLKVYSFDASIERGARVSVRARNYMSMRENEK